MALYKAITQGDGVVTSYHRVLFVQHTINGHNSIAVLSYVDDSARTAEKDATELQLYRSAITYETAYDDTMTAEKAYSYLKTLPQFEGAADV